MRSASKLSQSGVRSALYVPFIRQCPAAPICGVRNACPHFVDGGRHAVCSSGIPHGSHVEQFLKKCMWHLVFCTRHSLCATRCHFPVRECECGLRVRVTGKVSAVWVPCVKSVVLSREMISAEKIRGVNMAYVPSVRNSSPGFGKSIRKKYPDSISG